MGIAQRLAWLFRVRVIKALDRSASIAGNATTAATPAPWQGSSAASAARGTTQLPEDSTPPIRYDRIALLIAEGLVVRERLDGRIDAVTYQSRMHDLAAGRRT